MTSSSSTRVRKPVRFIWILLGCLLVVVRFCYCRRKFTAKDLCAYSRFQLVHLLANIECKFLRERGNGGFISFFIHDFLLSFFLFPSLYDFNKINILQLKVYCIIIH